MELKAFIHSTNIYFIYHALVTVLGSLVKKLPASAGDARDSGSIPRSGRSPEGGNGNPPQDSCLKYSMDRGAWWTIVQGIAKSWTQQSNYAHTLSQYPRDKAMKRDCTLPSSNLQYS